ncbi:MAG: RES family NAD+ phosphorylase [Acidobacteriota bacterium]
MKVWRICNSRHAETAFSGEGARLFSGRWNPKGVAMVYAATSLALASVEVFVHLEPEDVPKYLVSIEAELPVEAAACERVDVRRLPVDWRRERHPVLMEIGAEWVRSQRSLALMVPSVAVVGDWNVLVNPEHPDAGKMQLGKPEAFRFDERMFRG